MIRQTMNDLLPVLGVMFVVVMVLVSFAWQVGRSQTLLGRWAAQNHVAILSSERRWLRTGPFFFRHGESQTIYHVTVRDTAGRVRHAYVRCGGWFLGLFSDAVTVKWTD